LIDFDLLVLEKMFLKSQCIFTLLLLSPLGEKHSPSLKKNNLNPSQQGYVVTSLVRIGQVVLEKIFK
jgi:hypothetical protein